MDKLKRRATRIRNKQVSRKDKIRLSVHISNRFASVQAIDDAQSTTLAQLSTMSEKKSIGTSQAVLKKLGETFAATLKKLKLDGFYLDRGHRLYRGKLAAFTDALRQKGIQI